MFLTKPTLISSVHQSLANPTLFQPQLQLPHNSIVTHTSSPQRFETDIVSRMDLALSRVRQYQRFLGDWEGSQESGEGEGEQTVPESAELQGPPMVLNWRMKVGVSKVEGRRFVGDQLDLLKNLIS